MLFTILGITWVKWFLYHLQYWELLGKCVHIIHNSGNNLDKCSHINLNSGNNLGEGFYIIHNAGNNL